MDGGQTATYLYSADGLRVRSTVASNISDYIHDFGGTTVGILNSTGSLIRQEIGGMATYNDTGAYFHHRDWLGNLRVITDQAGTVKQTCTNLPYGDALNCTANGITPLAFTGYMRDSETNLDFANARYYSSQFGRFMSPDPLGGDVSDPQSLNRYAYVTNSPLSVVDPSGMDGCVIDGFADCVLTFNGAGDGGGAGLGGGSFNGGAGGAGGIIDLCGVVDCGFGGRSGLPGPPSGSQLASEQSFFQPGSIDNPGQFLLGIGEGMTVNALADFATLIDRMTLISFPKSYRSWHPERGRLVAGSYSEHAGMMLGAVAPILIPGAEEEGAISAIDPALVRFSQESISMAFSDGRSVEQLAIGLRNGSISPFDVPPVRVAELDGVLFTLDNRRLFAFKQAGVPIRYRMATRGEILAESWKFTTKNGGISIRIRK